MRWHISHRKDPEARAIADRHYNRQSIGAADFVPPGRCMVLKRRDAFWVTSWPMAEYVKHAWAGAMVCSAFRNEGSELSSALILDALSATRWKWPDLPELGMVSFVDRSQVRPKRDPGYCYLMAGFEPAGETAGGLLALRIAPGAFPPAQPPRNATGQLFS